MADQTPAQARVQAAADQLGAAMTDAIIEGLAKALGASLEKRGRAGPWVLRADGSLTEIDGEAP